MVDPNDYLKPMVFEPKDARWAKTDKGDDEHHED
jgi:hypothetical protein